MSSTRRTGAKTGVTLSLLAAARRASSIAAVFGLSGLNIRARAQNLVRSAVENPVAFRRADIRLMQSPSCSRAVAQGSKRSRAGPIGGVCKHHRDVARLLVHD